VITLDTSAIYGIANRNDNDHLRLVSALAGVDGPWIVPAATLGEAGYLLLDRIGSPQVLRRFLSDLRDGTYSLDCGEQDLDRIDELIQRYADLPLGLVDAAVIACAERNGGQVLTLDLRHFGVVAREGRITILPT